MKLPTVFILVGGVMAIGGLLALANPFAASIAVTTLVGFFFLLGGVGQLWAAWSTPEDEHRIWHGALGLMTLVLGVMFLADPIAGTLSLTLIVGVLFVISGATRLGVALRLRNSRSYWLLLLSGALSTVIGLLILANIAAAATSILGLLLGIQLLFEGGALIALGLIARER
ncbi:HdeD family acid-resistance protein [Albidovulum sp.]